MQDFITYSAFILLPVFVFFLSILVLIKFYSQAVILPLFQTKLMFSFTRLTYTDCKKNQTKLSLDDDRIKMVNVTADRGIILDGFNRDFSNKRLKQYYGFSSGYQLTQLKFFGNCNDTELLKEYSVMM